MLILLANYLLHLFIKYLKMLRIYRCFVLIIELILIEAEIFLLMFMKILIKILKIYLNNYLILNLYLYKILRNYQ